MGLNNKVMDGSVLHSHSGLERELDMPKHTVLVDESFKSLFASEPYTLFRHNGKRYIKVNILSFVKKGGLFKNLSE